jgi:hypothetical protein
MGMTYRGAGYLTGRRPSLERANPNVRVDGDSKCSYTNQGATTSDAKYF